MGVYQLNPHIIDERSDSKTMFCDLLAGQCFVSGDSVVRKSCVFQKNSSGMAQRLSDGQTINFANSERVFPVVVEIKIKANIP